MGKYLDSTGVAHFWERIKAKLDNKVDKVEGKGLFSGSYNDLTDKPTIPTLDGVADKDYVDEKINDLINSAPGTLDTLGEIAKAIQDNEDIIDTLNQAIGNKVDSETYEGKISDIEADINDINTNLSKKVDIDTYNSKMQSIDGDIQYLETSIPTPMSTTEIDTACNGFK